VIPTELSAAGTAAAAVAAADSVETQHVREDEVLFL
jgi:hypothetical protein